MRKLPILLITGLFLALCSLTSSSCKTKEGCGLEEKYGANFDADGNISSKKGKSNLFSKKQRKKMKKG